MKSTNKVYFYITGASITNEQTEIKIDKIHNKSGAKFTKDNLGENQTHTNRFSGNCTTGNDKNQVKFKITHLGQSTEYFDSNEHAEGGLLAKRDTDQKQTIMTINKRPVNIQIVKDGMPVMEVMNDVLRRTARLEEQNIQIQDQLNKILHIIN